ncbi:MAG TPA: hypothetical protein VMS96_06475 [Terriglobales bacterium]|nr:hypothetical protein [Terriglobales bacterium]
MNVFVVGLDHWLQPYDLQEYADDARREERKIKGQFYEFLDDLIKKEKISFVGEECRPGEKTIPRELARENRCEYGEIDMPQDLRRAANIPEDYEQHQGAVRDRGISLREDYMVKRFRELKTMDGPGLVICGAEHIPGLEKLLACNGDKVFTTDVRAAAWYDTILNKFLRGEI